MHLLRHTPRGSTGSPYFNGSTLNTFVMLCEIAPLTVLKYTFLNQMFETYIEKLKLCNTNVTKNWEKVKHLKFLMKQVIQ